jgi:hypothetical protein
LIVASSKQCTFSNSDATSLTIFCPPATSMPRSIRHLYVCCCCYRCTAAAPAAVSTGLLLRLLPTLLLLVIIQADGIIVCACWQGTVTRCCCCPLSSHCLAQALQQLRRRSNLHPQRRMLRTRRPLLLLHGLGKPKICSCSSGRVVRLLLLLPILLAGRLGQS